MFDSLYAHRMYINISIILPGSQCINCVPGVSYLVNAPIISMEWVVTHTWPMVLHATTHTTLRLNLVPMLGCYVAWIYMVTVY